MNRKILALLIVLIAAISIANVCAVELTKENDFDNIFKMKISDNDTFENLNNGTDYTTLLQSKVAYKNNDGSIYAFVYDTARTDAVFYSSYGEVEDFDIDGDLLTFNVSDKMKDELGGNVTVLAGKSSDDQTVTVFIGGNNETLVKEYANTIVFD